MGKPITQERMEEALDYLLETDVSCAAAKADMEREEFKAEAIKDAIFLRSSGNVEERKALSKTHPEYAIAKNKHFDAIKTYESIRNRRSTEEIVWETWRSINSNSRQAK